MKPLLLIFLGWWLALGTLHAADLPKPNFVILFIDDMGYGDIGPFSATKQRTPNLDRMAHEGMKLTSFYAAPVCSVSRAQLLTGCYGARVSVPGVFSPASKQGLHPKEFTIAERLKELGYATGLVGKWHVGDQPEFLPRRQGFDRYFGLPYSNDMQRKSKQTGQRVVPLQRDAVILAHGGVTTGYALHLKAGRVVFVVRTGAGNAFTEITTTGEVTSPIRIAVALAADATMKLTVNDQPAITGKARSLIPRQPAEDFCLGLDNGRPVTSYTAKENFQGTIKELKIFAP